MVASSLTSTLVTDQVKPETTIDNVIRNSTSTANVSVTSGIASSPSSQPDGVASDIQENEIADDDDSWLKTTNSSRHLESPLRKFQPTRRTGGANMSFTGPPRYYGKGNIGGDSRDRLKYVISSPDHIPIGECSDRHEPKNALLSDDFDDILTVTTTMDCLENRGDDRNDIVMIDYGDLQDSANQNAMMLNSTCSSTSRHQSHLNQTASKTSLINRFLRNVTQKKIHETSMKRNNFFAHKLKTQKRSLDGNLFVKMMKKPLNMDLIDDLNAEIAMEIEMSGVVNSPRRELINLDSGLGLPTRFEKGMGEISIEIFNNSINNNLTFLKTDQTNESSRPGEEERLLKVFKLYTGYSKEGYTTPVLVFLTDRKLYVIDLVRNCLCTKFVLSYNDLDVILVSLNIGMHFYTIFSI